MRRSIIALTGLAVLAAVTALMFGMLGGGVGKVQATTSITITATATGSSSVSCPTNGNFTVTVNPPLSPCDGVNEGTQWTFNFTGDAGFPAFQVCGALTHAWLTMTLQPLDSQFSNDVVYVGGPGGPGTLIPTIAVPFPTSGGWAPASPYNNVPLVLGQFSTMKRDLILDYPTPSGANSILGVLAANAGSIPMAYQDDAIISSAQLELTRDCQSGPSVVGGIAGLRDGAGGPVDASGSSANDYGSVLLAIAAAAAGGLILAVAAGGWYARRRWMR
jgi:hypothetical protein